jgi:hypothetical protein
MVTSSPTVSRSVIYIDIATIVLVAIETALISMALVPPQLWTRILPQSATAAMDGPFPPGIAPVITVLLYLVPTLIGFLSRHWQQALFYATLPVWIGLGIFLIAATSRVGIFYIVSADHVTANVSTLELFAVLGGIGWLGRYLFKIR